MICTNKWWKDYNWQTCGCALSAKCKLDSTSRFSDTSTLSIPQIIGRYLKKLECEWNYYKKEEGS